MANSISNEKETQVFHTNQTTVTYKLLSNLAAQQSPPKGINELKLDDTPKFTGEQFDLKRIVVRERYKFRGGFEAKARKNNSGACQQHTE